MFFLFYNRLIGLCAKNNIKPTALVRKLGLSPSMPKRWENGASPKSDAVQKIAEYFGVSIDYLIGAEKKEPVSQEANGLHSVGYNDLTPENQRLIDSMIEKLLKSQFGE